MGEPPPGSSPLDGTEPHQNERESILVAENEVPCDLDYQEYWNDLRCHEEEVGENDENGFPWNELIPESIDSINSDFSFSEVPEHTYSDISTFVWNETQDIDSFADVHLASLVENDGTLNDEISELIDSILSEDDEHQNSAYNNHSLNGTLNAVSHSNNTSTDSPQAANQFLAAPLPASSGEEVDLGEEIESWKIGDNPVSWSGDLGNEDMSWIYSNLPYSSDDDHNTAISSPPTSIEVISDSNSVCDALTESDAIPLEDLIRDLELPQDTLPYKDESMPVVKTVGASEYSIELGLAIKTPIPSKQSNRPYLSVIDTALPGTSSQSKQPGLLDLPGTSSQSNQVSVSAMPGPSSQSNQDGFSAMPGTSSQSDQLDLLDVPGTSSQSNQDRLPVVPGASSQPETSPQSIQDGLSAPQFKHVDFAAAGLNTFLPGIRLQSVQANTLSSLDTAMLPARAISSPAIQPGTNQIGMFGIGLAVVPVFFPLSGHQVLDHASPPSNWDNVAVLDDDQVVKPSTSTYDEKKKRKRRERMKIASKRHRQKNKAQEDALIAKEKGLLKENSELRGKLEQLSQEKEFYNSALKRRKELDDDSASLIKRVKMSQENTPAEEEL